jgi:rhodanese-related sulfurtransferase
MNTTITAQELQRLLASGSVCLIDVLLPEDFACRRIAGAGNACVYEMVFLERIAECVPDPERVVVVYDDSGTTQAARSAKEKLERAGYRNVAILEGGLQGWLAAGFEVEHGTPSPPPPVVRDGVYRLDTEKSVVEWTGRNINNRHYGRIAVSRGEVVILNKLPVSGRFVIDMDSLANLDLQDESWRDMLHRHLKSEDFFDVEISGKLTVKGATHPLCFPAMVAAQEDGTLKAQAALDLDRTLWDVCYGSGRLYERLGMHLVNDLISIELFIVAQKAA